MPATSHAEMRILYDGFNTAIAKIEKLVVGVALWVLWSLCSLMDFTTTFWNLLPELRLH